MFSCGIADVSSRCGFVNRLLVARRVTPVDSSCGRPGCARRGHRIGAGPPGRRHRPGRSAPPQGREWPRRHRLARRRPSVPRSTACVRISHRIPSRPPEAPGTGHRESRDRARNMELCSKTTCDPAGARMSSSSADRARVRRGRCGAGPPTGRSNTRRLAWLREYRSGRRRVRCRRGNRPFAVEATGLVILLYELESRAGAGGVRREVAGRCP